MDCEDNLTTSARVPVVAPGALSLLERGLPFRELSLIAEADRRARDPAYGGHSWFARRPPGVMRGLLLAAALPTSATKDYWDWFRSAAPVLEGLRAHDPFTGGGTILLEAARLGATPTGMDVDPLAVKIVTHELRPPARDDLDKHAADLLAHLRRTTGHLFAATRQAWTPLHYFYLHLVTCPDCGDRGPLYRDLVIARDLEKHGAVVRDSALVVFCPACLRVHQLRDGERVQVDCCGQRHRLYEGNYYAQTYKCPRCHRKSKHSELKTGACPRQLVAVEETNEDQYRRIRKATATDSALTETARRYIARHRQELRLPTGAFSRDRIDARPRSLGMSKAVDLFTDRQLAVFGRGFARLEALDLTKEIRLALALGLSNALSTNNKLCGYARDYGRIAPLFSVRGYSLPALAVELNPFHPNAGRGTLAKVFDRLGRSCATDSVRRYFWNPTTEELRAEAMTFSATAYPDVRCVSAATEIPEQKNTVDLCVFDPPYFDYIAYSELSEFFRLWLRSPKLGGRPLFPTGDDAAQSFGDDLGDCLKAIEKRVKQGRPIAFTYHAARDDAWKAVGAALDAAGLLVTALWPLRNDIHMGHHTADGNCEWDIVVVCRRATECLRIKSPLRVSLWKNRLVGFEIRAADERGMQCALEMAKSRYGRPADLSQRRRPQ